MIALETKITTIGCSAAANLANFFATPNLIKGGAPSGSEPAPESEEPVLETPEPPTENEYAALFQNPLMIADPSICRNGDEYSSLPVVVHQSENYVSIFLDCDVNAQFGIVGELEFIEVTCSKKLPKALADDFAQRQRLMEDNVSSDVLAALFSSWDYEGSITIFPNHPEKQFLLDVGKNWHRRTVDVDGANGACRVKVVIIPKQYKPRDKAPGARRLLGAEDV